MLDDCVFISCPQCNSPGCELLDRPDLLAVEVECRDCGYYEWIDDSDVAILDCTTEDALP